MNAEDIAEVVEQSLIYDVRSRVPFDLQEWPVELCHHLLDELKLRGRQPA